MRYTYYRFIIDKILNLKEKYDPNLLNFTNIYMP